MRQRLQLLAEVNEGLTLVLVVGPDLRAPEGLAQLVEGMPGEQRWHRLDREGPALGAQLADSSVMGRGDGDAPVLWVATLQDGVYRIDDPDGDARLADWHVGMKDGMPANTARALAQFGGPDGRDLWIASGYGVTRVARDRLVVYGEGVRLTSSTASVLVPSVDDEGRPVLLAGLQRGGLVRFRDDGSWQRESLAQGLPDDAIYSILLTDRDRAQPRLWLGTQGVGAIRREAGRWSVIDTRHGLPARSVRGVGRNAFPDGTEGFWIGTVGGAVQLRDGRWQPLGPPAIASAQVYDLARASDGSVWLGTDRGLVHWRSDGIDTIDRTQTHFPANTIIAVLVSRDDDGNEEVWLGARHGLALVRDGKLARLAKWPQHLGPAVRTFAESRDRGGRRTLWAGGEGGVESWHEGRWTPLPGNCLPHEEVMDLRVRGEPGAQSLWIATRGGIARVDLDDGNACEALSGPALPMAVVYQLRHDGNGRVYLFGYEGALRLTPDPAAPGSLARMRVERYDENDGLPALEFNRATHVDERGRIWAGGVAGAVVFDPAAELPPQPARPLLLTSAVVLEPDEPLAPGALLPASHNSVRFEFALMSYEREHLTRYRTQLVGLDASPRAWTTEPGITYARVPPGDYVFRVWARDAFGTISGPREQPFAVAVPRWQSPLAIGLYLIAFALLAMAWSRSRSRGLAQRAESLAREVDERTRALGELNRQLEQASLTDPLTGLANRRHFAAHVAGQLERAGVVIEVPGHRRVLAVAEVEADGGVGAGEDAEVRTKGAVDGPDGHRPVRHRRPHEPDTRIWRAGFAGLARGIRDAAGGHPATPRQPRGLFNVVVQRRRRCRRRSAP